MDCFIRLMRILIFCYDSVTPESFIFLKTFRFIPVRSKGRQIKLTSNKQPSKYVNQEIWICCYW